MLRALASAAGRPYLCLEHDADWYVLNGIDAVLQGQVPTGVVQAPLASYGEFDWYNISGISMADSYALVVCDGPPGSTRGGRYGALPVLGRRLDNAVLLMDDADRDSSILERWRRDFGASFEMTPGTENYKAVAMVRLPDGFPDEESVPFPTNV